MELKYHQKIVAEIQTETIQDLIANHPSELGEFISRERLIPHPAMKRELNRLPLPPLDLLYRCPLFLRKLAVRPHYSQELGPREYLTRLGKYVVRRCLITLLKGYAVLQRERS